MSPSVGYGKPCLPVQISVREIDWVSTVFSSAQPELVLKLLAAGLTVGSGGHVIERWRLTVITITSSYTPHFAATIWLWAALEASLTFSVHLVPLPQTRV